MKLNRMSWVGDQHLTLGVEAQVIRMDVREQDAFLQVVRERLADTVQARVA
jgi:hypothetical protein